MTIITVPNGYGYVLLAASSTAFLNTFHAILTSTRRKAAGVKYPITYVTAEQADKDPKAYAFNCAQRAHANFTENLTPFLTALLISGLKYPVYSAVLGGTWAFGRVLFALGYTSKGPQGRTTGGYLASLSNIVLALGAAYTALGFALGW
ncbi:membrane-associated proteins in eicosanoid and glutathione metabolism [Parathielavia appendiculata]|uniref:Membrane-associated proteins in eicosanoid and glutathione metabolism n=1 Tax=Parathielavia appendiculata TaxID=2587402 RepID=A0AAN6Z7X0_9PEZI|nr:membrane-associated proteins in eicosanoid and glutathione metabolism [Parathielavia appendiculata]